MNERYLLYQLGVLHRSIHYYQQFGVSPEVNDQLLQAQHKTLCDALSESKSRWPN